MSRRHGPALGRARWFRNLRRLHLWLGRGDVLRSCRVACDAAADVPNATNAVHKPGADSTIRGERSFPRLAHLDLTDCPLSTEHVAAIGRCRLRHLQPGRNEVRRVGCEALATAPFAATLRVLDMRGAEVSSGGVQALAESGALAELRHLDLAENPIGPGGLAALADSPHLRGLRAPRPGTPTRRAGQSVPATCRRFWTLWTCLNSAT